MNSPDMPHAEGQKLSHAEVHYGMAKPGGDRCGKCEYFRGKDDCQIVIAPIYPAGVCDHFEAKEAATANESPQGEAAERTQPAQPQAPDVMAHGRAIAGAKALHAVGHISEKERDKHVKKSTDAMKTAPRKAFGSWAP